MTFKVKNFEKYGFVFDTKKNQYEKKRGDGKIMIVVKEGGYLIRVLFGVYLTEYFYSFDTDIRVYRNLLGYVDYRTLNRQK